MAYDKTKTNKTSKNIPEGIPDDADWGFESDGESTNTFGPAVRSTPNKVGAEDFAPKKGKGEITGGIEDESIFGNIEYTGNTIGAGKKDYNSVDKSVWNGINYSFTTEGMPGGDNDGVFGSGGFAAKDKDKKVNGNIEKGEAEREANVGANYQGKRRLPVTDQGKNPTSDNVKISTNIFTKRKD